MTTSGWQRRELRRDLPPAVRQRNIKVLNHLGIARMIASRQTQRDHRSGTFSSKRPVLASFVAGSGLIGLKPSTS